MKHLKIEHLLLQVKEAQKKAESELLRLYPAGKDVHFTIMSGQRNPSTGRVLGPGWRDGYLRVLHHEAKENSRYQVRSVHYTDVLGIVE